MEFQFFFPVIEVACGEYGDNISSLVAAIKNGKHDIREGLPFPETKGENLNNANQTNALSKNVEAEGSKDDSNISDKNDANNIQDKYTDKSPIENQNNGSILPKYATNDIAKNSSKFIYYKKLKHDIENFRIKIKLLFYFIFQTKL